MVYRFFFSVFFLLSLTSFTGVEINKDMRSGKDYALFFAIDQYDEWQDLRYPISDASNIAKELEQNYGFETEVVKNPTQIQIYKKLEAYRKRTYASDAQLLVFFTGHGTFTETQEGFFIPADGEKDDFIQTSYMPHARLNRIVNAIPCNHILLGLDACFSGTFDEAIALNKGDERPGASENARQKFIDRTLEYKSRLFVTSGGKERTPDRSQFAQQFLAALRNFGGADNIVSINELIGFLQMAQPTPRSGQFGNHDIGGDFLFVLDNEPNIKNHAINGSRQLDLMAWNKAEKLNTITAYQNYLDGNSKGLFRGKANTKIENLNDQTEWQIAQSFHTKEAYENYLKSSPNPKKWNEAEEFIQVFSKAEKAKKNQAESKDFFGSILGSEKGETYFTDTRDNQVYSAITMKDGKKWMTKNLNHAITGSYCYDNDAKNCQKYGRLYTWEAAKKACPKGWHLPTDEEWWEMTKQYEKVRSILFSGYRAANGEFSLLGSHGNYWSATENTIGFAWSYNFEDNNNGRGYNEKGSALSCRCIKD